MGTPIQVEALIAGLTDSSGNPLAAGKVYTYDAGTSTPRTTWQDNLKASSHTNPIILDGQGKKLVFADGAYKFIIANSADVVQYTHDNLLFSPFSGSSLYGGNSTGAAGAYAINLSPALLTDPPATGTIVSFIPNHTNTSTATLNIQGLGTRPVISGAGVALTGGEIRSGQLILMQFSGTSWLLINPDIAWKTYAPTVTGFSVAPTGILGRYQVVGRTCNLAVSMPNSGTSNATSFTCSLPLTAATVATMFWGAVPFSITDNGAASTTPGQVTIASGASTATLARSISGAGGGWTNVNGKSASFYISYEI